MHNKREFFSKKRFFEKILLLVNLYDIIIIPAGK
nr:MAG TPA: hypothetical protein [Caudoviricetes sp.]